MNLYYLVNTPVGGELREINSAALSGPSPAVQTLAAFDYSVTLGAQNYPSNPLRAVGEFLVFGATYYEPEGYSTQFWVSDGTLGGTVASGQPFAGYGTVSSLTTFAGSAYFIYRPQVGEVSESTVVAQIWKLDIATQQFTVAAEFLGIDNYYYPPTDLLVGGDKLYFSAWDASVARQARLVFDGRCHGSDARAGKVRQPLFPA